MLPFLLAGGVALLGKAVYDAVTKDSSSTSSTSSSSSSSSSGSVSQAELAKARQKAKAEQKKARTDELIASTSREVQSLLDTHAHLVGGEARLTPPPLIQGALSSWPTGTAELLTLKLHLLRKTAAIPNTASGLDLLTPREGACFQESSFRAGDQRFQQSFAPRPESCRHFGQEP